MNVIFKSGSGILTREQLSEYSSSIAGFLKENNINTAAILCGKSPLVFAAMIGCQKVGVCYVPVEQSLPHERKKMIFDTADIVLYDGNNIKSDIGTDLVKVIESSCEFIESEINLDSPVYKIYTSGTTGVPKGIEVSVRNVKSFLNWLCAIPAIAEIKPKSVLNQALFSFDLSVADIFYSLKNNATLTVIEKELSSDFCALFERMRESGSEMAVFTPSFAELCLCDRSFCDELMPDLKLIFFCGEVLKPVTVEKIFRRFPNVRILNAYGPTEATCAVTAIEITPEMLGKMLPVGDMSCVAGDIHISDEDEIVITGESVARYCEKSGGFGEYNGERCFYTGDIGYIDNNLLYFLGRRDRQLKVMGYRIELEDIENNLIKIDGVTRAVAVASEVGNFTAVTAYVCTENEVSVGYIREKMSELVPDYMMPKRIRIVDEIPVNINGKTDRSKLNV